MLTTVQGLQSDEPFRLQVAHPLIFAWVWLLQCLRERGDFVEGVAYGHDAYQMAEARGCPYELLSVYVRLGHLPVRQGALSQAIPLLERAVALSQEADMPNFYHIAAASLALAYALAGRV